jgi:hypothetical protein
MRGVEGKCLEGKGDLKGKSPTKSLSKWEIVGIRWNYNSMGEM